MMALLMMLVSVTALMSGCRSGENGSVYVYCYGDYFDPEIIEENAIYGTPDLVVEILSPSTARNDKIRKKAAYEKYGVKEYWIVDPMSKSVEVYLRKEDKLILDDVYSTYKDFEWKALTEEEKAAVKHAIKVSLYDDFYVQMVDIFENVK